MIRGLSFDLFDTLIDLEMGRLPTYELAGKPRYGTQGKLWQAARRYRPLELQAFVKRLAEVDRDLRDARAERGLELPTYERFEALATALRIEDPTFAAVLTETHMSAFREHAVFVPHHQEVLRGLAPDFRLALCSNFSHSPTALRLLDEAGLYGFFESIAISDTVGIRKPRPEIFDAMLGELGLPPGEVLHVGDRLDADVAGALARGLPAAWLTRRIEDPETVLREWPGPPPTYVISDVSELRALLRDA